MAPAIGLEKLCSPPLLRSGGILAYEGVLAHPRLVGQQLYLPQRLLGRDPLLLLRPLLFPKNCLPTYQQSY